MIYGIQLLRFVAAAIVAALHTFKAVDGNGGQVFGRAVTDWTYAFGFGASGVPVFFVISGFIIVYTQRRKFGQAQPLNFLLKRADRIYPIYWICAAITLLVTITLHTYEIPGTLEGWIGGLVLAPGYSGAFIYVGWTLGYEVYFYLVFALFLALNWAMLPTLATLSLFFLASIAGGHFLHIADTSVLSAPVSVLLLDFLMGAWAAWMVHAHGENLRALGRPLILLGVCGFVATFLIGYDSVPRIVTWGIPSFALVLGLALAERGDAPEWLRRFQPLGDASYALYLIHPAIIWVLKAATVGRERLDDVSFATFVLASLALSIAASVALDKFVQPRIRFKRHSAPRPTYQLASERRKSS